MRAAGARDIAREWVADEGAKIAGFAGAYFAGSINWLADDGELPPTSDVDLWVVLAGTGTPGKLGKFLYRGLVLEVSYATSEQLEPIEAILGDYHRASSFRTPSVIADPTGQLGVLQSAVEKDFAKREWVVKRCEHARANVQRNVRALRDSQPLHAQVTNWLFANGVLTHILLVAGLRNPTVRKRYAATRDLLKEYGRLDFYEELLELLGCRRMDQSRAAYHLAALTEAFDTAKAVIKTPVFFVGDISDIGRPIAITGSSDLIASGLHREAIFWIAATYARCMQVLIADARPETQQKLEHGFRELIGDLGIRSFEDLQQGLARVEACIPRAWEVAEEIMAANPEIHD